MKRIIDGLLYDTDAAEVIAVDGCVELYRTKHGIYFLHRCVVGWSPEQIDTISGERLREWLGDACRDDLLKEIFGIEVKEA